jgi:hypothetical protein
VILPTNCILALSASPSSHPCPVTTCRDTRIQVGGRGHSRGDVRDSGKRKAGNTTTVMKPSGPLCRVESTQGER